MIKRYLFAICLLLVSSNLLAQCDSSFYTFKRAIIRKLSGIVGFNLDVRIPEKTIKLEFSDFQRFAYAVSDPQSTLGFVCMRNETCNNFSDSICIVSNELNGNTYSFERTLFENFMSSDDIKICDSIKYVHTLAQVIENPIEGWGSVENFYFRFAGNDDLSKFYKGKSVFVTIPIYFFLDKKLIQGYFFTVKIEGTQTSNIKIDRSVIVNY